MTKICHAVIWSTCTVDSDYTYILTLHMAVVWWIRSISDQIKASFKKKITTQEHV